MTQLVWDAEKDNAETCAKIREALRNVKDPEMGLDVLQLGLIRNVVISNNKVILKMILTTPFCPFGPAMLAETQKNVQTAINFPTEVEMLDEPWDMSMMEDGIGLNWGLYR
jgi:metal-sulfur cluster biosynthetic enzyme